MLWEQDAAGSNPVTPTIKNPHQIAIYWLFGAGSLWFFMLIMLILTKTYDKI